MTGPRGGSVFITGGVFRKALAAGLALKSAGVRVTIGDPSPLALSLWSLRIDHRVLYPRADTGEEAFLDFMVKRLKEHPVDLLFAAGGQDEINAIHRNRDRFEGLTRIGLSPHDLLETTEDKGVLLKRAEAAGIPIPATWYPETVEEALDNAADYRYPALIKPRRASGGRGIVHVPDADALRRNYAAVAAQYTQPLIQEFVPADGHGLGVTALFDPQSRPVALFSYKRLREFPIGAGPSTFTESTDDPEIKTTARKMLEALGWQGLAMVEFRRDRRDGVAKLIEVNGRFWGSAQLPIVCGLNFPYLYYRLMMEGRVDPPPPYKVGVRCRWLFPGDTLHFLTNPERWNMDPPFFQFFGKDLHYDPPMFPDPFPMVGQVVWAVRSVFDAETVRRYLKRR